MTTATAHRFVGYAQVMHEGTGRTDPRELSLIEECVRQDIFHSTLDWQTRDMLKAAAQEAELIMVALEQIPAKDAAQARLAASLV